MQSILIIEDDKALSIGICFDLEKQGYRVFSSSNKVTALQLIYENEIDLAILDVNLPDGNGFELCSKIKEYKNIPIIFLTACDLESDQIKGFEYGADDYITKPFNIVLLRKRISAVLRRYYKNKENIYTDGFLTIDFDKLIVYKNKEPLNLTKTEYKLLKIFVANNKSVLTRQLLLEKLWDNDGNFVDEHALTVNINRLRSKLEDNVHKYIKTVYGMGYLWIGEQYVF